MSNLDYSGKKFLAATNNKDKLKEFKAVLAKLNCNIVSPSDFQNYPEPIETADNLVDNALLKSRFGFDKTGLWSIADDTGLFVDALKGEPGVYSARYAGEDCTYQDNVNKMLRNLLGVPLSKRTAQFKCVITLSGFGADFIFEGQTKGIITEHPIGAKGFGYDPIFFSQDLGMTFAEADTELKNSVSHRGKALNLLRKFLQETDLKHEFNQT